MTSPYLAPGGNPEAEAAVALAVGLAVNGIGRVRVRVPGVAGSGAERAEHLVTADELTVLIGAEAARYALIRHARSPAAVIDLDTWRRPNDNNPVHRVRFAHARLAALGRYAVALGFTVTVPGDTTPGTTSPVVDLGIVSDPAGAGPPEPADPATALLRRTLEEYPVVLDNPATRRQPHRLTRTLERTADAVRRYLATVRVLPTPAPGGNIPTAVTITRLALADNARRSIASGLGVLGITAPVQL